MHRLERSVEYVTNKDKTVRPRPDSASSLQEAVDYTRNREKTECDVFESAIGCTLETAFEDMLHHMDDPLSPVPSGTEGTVLFVDDAGQLHMKWDNGRTLALVPGVDSFARINKPEKEKKKGGEAR